MYGMWIIVIGLIIIAGIISLMPYLIVSRRHKKDRYVYGYSDYAGWYIGAGIVAFIAFICIFPSIFIPIEAKNELQRFENDRVAITQLMEAVPASSPDRAALINKVTELNQWLTSARASKQTYGIFSAYVYLDLRESKVPLITIVFPSSL